MPLYWHEVASLEAGKNYVTLRAPARGLIHALRGSLASVLDQLVPPALRPQFLRVNRSTLLYAAHITAQDEEFVHCGRCVSRMTTRPTASCWSCLALSANRRWV